MIPSGATNLAFISIWIGNSESLIDLKPNKPHSFKDFSGIFGDLFASKIKGQFKEFDGFIVIDLDDKENNKALFSVQINSIEFNYEKYKELLFSDFFFDEKKFPIVIIDAKNFVLPTNSNTLLINVELQIKDIIHIIPLKVIFNHLTNNFVQVTTSFKFSRNNYKLGKDEWSSSLILRDKINVKVNLFFNRN